MELKPCPFCGREARIAKLKVESKFTDFTCVGSCTDGFCQGYLEPDGKSLFVNSWDNEELAMEQWNRRAGENE